MSTPTSIDEVDLELKLVGYDGIWITDKKGDRYFPVKTILALLTTLVEQAKGEGREEAVSFIANRFNTDDPLGVANDKNWLKQVFDAARTISSDKK